MADLICWNCARGTGIEGKVMRSDNCPHCMSALRCCRGCRFFDPSQRFQCRESMSIDGPVAIKEKANFCDYFEMRQAFHSHGKKFNPIEAKDSKKKRFDDLFDD